MKSKLAVACLVLAFCAAGVMGVYFAYKRVMLHIFVDGQFGSGDEANLIYAAMDGDEGRLESYLAKGVPIDAYNHAKQYNPLCVAIIERNRSAVLLLLKHGANPNAQNGPGEFAIFVFSDHNDPWYMETLLKHGLDPNAQLDNAITHRCLPIVKMLVAAGADINRRDPTTWSNYLINAGALNSFDIMYYLLQQGENPAPNEEQLNYLLYSLNRNNYLPPKDDYRPRVIEWMKDRHLYKDEAQIEAIWKAHPTGPVWHRSDTGGTTVGGTGGQQ